MKHPSLIPTERFLIAAFILCIGGCLLIYQQIDRQHAKADLVTHSYIVKITLNQLLLNLTEAETNQRGYLLTHDSDFLQHYDDAMHKSRSLINILDSLTVDNSHQREQLDKLRNQFNSEVVNLYTSMILPDGKDVTEEGSEAIAGNTREILNSLRITVYSMLAAEDRLLQQRILDKEASTKVNPYLSMIVFLLFLLLSFLVYLKLKKETDLRLDSDEQLATQNAIFHQAEKMALIGSYTWNAATGEMRLSDNLCRLLGYEPQESALSPGQLLRLVHPADKHRVTYNGKPTLERLMRAEMPCRFITTDGIIKYLHVTGSPVYKPEGEVIVGTFQDVTREIELRQTLENNDNFIRSLLGVAPSIITIFDVESRSIVFTSRRYFHSAGRSPELPSGLADLAGMIHPEDRKAALHYFQQLQRLPDMEMAEFEYRVRGIEGDYHYWLTRSTPYKRNGDNMAIQFISATIDITEKVRAEMELKAKSEALLISRYEQQSASRFKTMADSMPQIVWTAKPTGEIDYFNQRWYEIMQGGAADPTTSEAPDLVENMHPDDRTAYFSHWDSCLSTGRPFQMEFRFRDHKHPGEYCWFLAKALPIYDQGGAVLRWHGTFTDINDQKLAQLAIQQLVKEKEDFISIASHELKTPVTILKGSIQLLEQEAGTITLPAETSQLIEMAGRQVNKLTRMVADLLDVAKLNGERVRLAKSDLLLGEVIEESIEQVSGPGIRDSIRVTGTTDVRVHANRERIGQVITNFLSNAKKYSPEGSVIAIDVSQEDHCVRVAVRDEGIGIPKSKLPFVFDRFFRVEESAGRISGLGLGLYISAEIVALHQGEIGVDSEPGKGSTFWFTLPV